MENILVITDEVGSVLLLVGVVVSIWWIYFGIKKYLNRKIEVACIGHWFEKGETIEVSDTHIAPKGIYKIVSVKRNTIFIRRKIWRNHQ